MSRSRHGHSVTTTGFFHLDSDLSFLNFFEKNGRFDTLSHLVASCAQGAAHKYAGLPTWAADACNFCGTLQGSTDTARWLRCLVHGLFVFEIQFADDLRHVRFHLLANAAEMKLIMCSRARSIGRHFCLCDREHGRQDPDLWQSRRWYVHPGEMEYDMTPTAL